MGGFQIHRGFCRGLGTPIFSAPRLILRLFGAGFGEQIIAVIFDDLPVMRFDRSILNAVQSLAQIGIKGGAAFGAVKNATFCFALPQQLYHRLGIVEQSLHCFGPGRLNQIVWVLTFGKQAKPQGFARLQQRQGNIDQPHCGT